MTVIAVLKKYEGRGIGKHLLHEVADWLFRSGNDEIWLVTTPDPDFRAYGFYRSAGWVATGEVDEDGEKFVLRKP